MARTRKNSRKSSRASQQGRAGGGRSYTAGEWFIAILGGAFVILILGIVVTAVLG